MGSGSDGNGGAAQRSAAQRKAGRRRAERARCGACGRQNATHRVRMDVFCVIRVCRYCKHEKVVDSLRAAEINP